MKTARVDHARVRQLASQGWTDDAIAREVGCVPRYAQMIRLGRIKLRADGGSKRSRYEPASLTGSTARLPPFDHPALAQAETMFPLTRTAADGRLVLQSGANTAKIGRRIEKGKWKGFEVYTLTLEERATCPMSCRHWRSCYGNHMHLARRFGHGVALENHLRLEVASLARKHPDGFAIRLHNLGDFYSVSYVEMWRELLDRHRSFHAFGFSARHDYHGDPVAKALIDLIGKRWSRFAIRLSNAPIEHCSTISIEHPFQKPSDAIICPQQIGKTAACSTCALCWQSTKRIAFIQH